MVDKTNFHHGLREVKERNGGFTLTELAKFLHTDKKRVRKLGNAVSVDFGAPARVVTKDEAGAIIAEYYRQRGARLIRRMHRLTRPRVAKTPKPEPAGDDNG